MANTIMGMRIKEKRLENGLTMEGLANKLGVGNSAVNKWEKGHVTNIKRDTIEHMAKIFNCDPAWLMGYDDSGTVESESFTDEEKNILLEYRNADPATKEMIRRLLVYSKLGERL